MENNTAAAARAALHAKLREEERNDILAQAEREGLNVYEPSRLPFKELQDVWSDWLSDEALAAGKVL